MGAAVGGGVMVGGDWGGERGLENRGVRYVRR